MGSISFDDIYNNFKIVELEVKRCVISSSNSGSQNLAFLSGHSSTNDVNTANVHVSIGSTPVSTARANNSTACLSDAIVYAYLATQPNGSQVVHEDLEQIHEDHLDEMDLKWQLALLSMKARKFYQKTSKKIIINGSDTASYDKKKVECFNCHKLGHFARECRNPKSQENRNRSQDSSRRTVNVEESSSKAMLAIDGTGFDWSYMADEEASTNFALMAFSDSEVQNNKTCSKTCLKNFEDLKSKYDKLRIELNKSESDLDSYKKGLASVEEQLVFYKKNESMLCDQIVVLKRDASFNESDINALKKQVERLKKEKEDNQFKIDNFENASKSLDQLIGNQISDNNKKGLGYNVVNKGTSENVSKEVKKTLDAPIIEDWVSDCDEDETVVLESLNVQKPKQVDQPRKVSQNPRNNSTICDFHDKRMVQKPVLNNVKKETGQRKVRPVWTNAMRLNHQKISNSRRNFASTAVLTKSGLVPLSTARQSFSRTTAPVSAARNHPERKPLGDEESIRDFLSSFSSMIPFDVLFYLGHMFRPLDFFYVIHVDLIIGKPSDEVMLDVNTVGDIFLQLREVSTVRLDRQDLSQLYSLVQERFKDHPLEGRDLDLWGDLRMIFDPNKEDDIWLNQQYWELMRWKLHEYSGVHSLFLDGTSIQINMLVEKKYPLKKGNLGEMINLKIEAEEDSNMAIELIKFIKS
ncbi:ribonuclease H-like domain-containing protein [Tanacetum coccineum]